MRRYIPTHAHSLDEQLKSTDLQAALRPPYLGWSRGVRHALNLTLVDLCQRLHISQPAATKLEQSEMKETITIRKLRGIAKAMNCDFVYGFVPRGSFEALGAAETAKKKEAKNARRRAMRRRAA
jgi:predicted DNA-binding mobile mystery protein A